VFASFDVLVLPSLWWETTGLVLLEAMAEGKAVVASRIGGIPEVVGGTGRLVTPGDVAALREALDAVTSGRSRAEAEPTPSIPTAEEGAAQLLALYASLRTAR
jgi:glycosyltransferase involved in cell wall biosynthesis